MGLNCWMVVGGGDVVSFGGMEEDDGGMGWVMMGGGEGCWMVGMGETGGGWVVCYFFHIVADSHFFFSPYLSPKLLLISVSCSLRDDSSELASLAMEAWYTMEVVESCGFNVSFVDFRYLALTGFGSEFCEGRGGGGGVEVDYLTEALKSSVKIS